jgi:hypothetical protein
MFLIRIRIRTNMSWIRNTDLNIFEILFFYVFHLQLFLESKLFLKFFVNLFCQSLLMETCSLGSDHPVLKTAKRLLYHGKNNMQVQFIEVRA